MVLATVTGTEVIQGFSMLDVKNRTVSKGIEEIIDVTLVASTPFSPVDEHEEVEEDAIPELDLGDSVTTSDTEPEVLPFVPTIRSGSFADIGPRRYMEDEHICIDDLSSHMGSLFTFPSPSAFYGVFDGHGGPDAAAYVKRHAMRFFFEESVFPQASDADNVFIESVECSVRKAFSLADHGLADDCTISSSSGTTALAAWVFGRLLLVANAGDCRAVLCRKGEAINMSHDHRPIYPSERHRIELSGGYIDDGYLNGVLSVSRALGDWDMKLPRGSSSPLISEPEFTQTFLTEEDEFLIIGCDGIWDVMSSQHAVSIVRRGLRRHDNPEQCARELVREALRLNTFDNLTVIVVCFTRDIRDERKEKEVKLRCCSLSAEALCNLRSWLDN